jgi:hypothetical protein
LRSGAAPREGIVMIRLDPRRILIALLATDMALLSAFLLAEYGGGPMRLRARW